MITGNDFADIYYREKLGHSVDYKSERETANTFQYMIDSGFEDDEILNYIKNVFFCGVITYDMLPDSIWDDPKNILRRNAYYFHSEFTIVSPPTNIQIVDGVSKIMPTATYWYEPKIRYFDFQARDYFYRSFYRYINTGTDDVKTRDLGGIRYLLKEYAAVDPHVEAPDLLFRAIDYGAMTRQGRISSVLDLRSDIEDVIVGVIEHHTEALESGACRIVRRPIE